MIIHCQLDNFSVSLTIDIGADEQTLSTLKDDDNNVDGQALHKIKLEHMS